MELGWKGRSVVRRDFRQSLVDPVLWLLGSHIARRTDAVVGIDEAERKISQVARSVQVLQMDRPHFESEMVQPRN